MTLKQYQQAAQRTSPDDHDKLLNGILGLIGESGEIVDTIKKQKFQGMPEEKALPRMTEELGDVIWYVAEACAGIGKNITDLDTATQDDERCPHNIETCAVRLVGAACEAFTAINRLEVRDYAAIVAFRRLCKIWLLIHSLCDRLGVQPDTVMRENIKKLKRRYPDGFDAERSNERYEQS